MRRLRAWISSSATITSPPREIPRAVAVLDPKRIDCTYPFDELSGCGVGFKLVQAYAMKKRDAFFSSIAPLLDLLVVSIASDIVPLVGENRIPAHYGLELLNRAPSKGLLSIIKICGLNKHSITIDDIVQDRAAHQRRRPYADGRKRRKRRAVGRIRRREPARREQRERRRRLRVDHRRLQPGPQVDRPPRDAGGARDHREQPRTEKPQEHGHLQSQVDEGASSASSRRA